jgi:hypothetical protein
MAEAFQHRVPAALQDLGKGGIAVKPGAHRQHVDETADDPFQLLARASRDGRADREVPLAGVARQDDLESGHESHVKGGAVATAQLGQGFGKPGVQALPEPSLLLSSGIGKVSPGHFI